MTTLASLNARSYSSDTMSITRPMYSPSTTGVQVLTTDWVEILRNDLTSGELVEVAMHFCNRGSDSDFSVAIVPHGSSPGVEYLIYDETPTSGGESLTPPFKPVLKAGDSVWAKASDLDTINMVVTYLSEQ